MFNTIREIKELNKENGYHFFDDNTMRFFNSKVLKGVYKGKYFITSERFDYNTPRYYSIREIKLDGSIETIGEFQEFKTPNAARNYIENNL